MRKQVIRVVTLLTVFAIGAAVGWESSWQWTVKAQRAERFARSLQAQELYKKGAWTEAMEAAQLALAANPTSYSNYDLIADLLAREPRPAYALHMYERALILLDSGSTSSGINFTENQKQFERDRIKKKIDSLDASRKKVAEAR